MFWGENTINIKSETSIEKLDQVDISTLTLKFNIPNLASENTSQG